MSSKIIRATDNIKTLHFHQLPETVKPEEAPADVSLIGQDQCLPTADAVLAEAAAQAAAIVQEAQARAQQIEREARQRGYDEGLESARVETAKMMGTVRSAAEQALEEKWRVINDVEEDIVALAMQIAEKIVDEHVAVKENTVVTLAKKALMLAAEREHIVVRVNPEDLELMRAHKEDLMAMIDGVSKVEVIADRRVRRGGCVLETASGNVDARIQSQLGQIEQSLRDVVSGE